jgi:uncharacterized metal-binding protein YceD (DUF177 family)
MSTHPKTPGAEFSRPIEVARVSPLGSHEKISADVKECEALARRLNLPAVHAVDAHLVLKPWRGGGIKVTGQVTADIDQQSVVSLEAFRSTVNFDVARYFLAHVEGEEDGERDVDLITGGVIDIGEVAAESLALELDPYPRKPGEEFHMSTEDGTPQASITPFDKLKPKR